MKKLNLLLASGVSFVVAAPAMAAVDPSFSSAVTSVTADLALYGAALVTIAAVGVTFGIAMKYVKKIRGAA